MASYVERDGDWVLRATGNLDGVSMWALVLKAGEKELESLCDRFINKPSGGSVTARPLVKGVPFVLLVCADIQKGYSTDADDQYCGWMTERDVGFFVPVTITANGVSRTANLLPYLFVDNFPAVVIGREIFGFPKVLGKIDFAGSALTPIFAKAAPMHVTLTSKIVPIGGAKGPVLDGVVVDVRSTNQRVPLPVPFFADEAMEFIAAFVLGALGAPKSLGAKFKTIPMAFLKEFRTAVNRSDAAHQSVVLAEAAIDRFSGGGILRDDFEVTIPRYENIHIADTLGLGAGSLFKPIATVSVAIDFSLPFGNALWTCP